MTLVSFQLLSAAACFFLSPANLTLDCCSAKLPLYQPDDYVLISPALGTWPHLHPFLMTQLL